MVLSKCTDIGKQLEIICGKIDAMRPSGFVNSFISANDHSIISDLGIDRDVQLDKKLEDIIKNPKKSVKFVVPKKNSAQSPQSKIDDDDLLKLCDIESTPKRKPKGVLNSKKKFKYSSPQQVILYTVTFDEISSILAKGGPIKVNIHSLKDNTLKNSLSFREAFTFKIQCVCNAKSKCSICSDSKTISKERMFELMKPKINQKAFDLIFSLIVWKLSSFENHTKARLLTLASIILQMIKKCKKPIALPNPSIHNVFVVCVIILSNNIYQLLLTDGRSTIMTEKYEETDKTNINSNLIFTLINQNIIKVGDKIHSANATFIKVKEEFKTVTIKDSIIALNYNGLSRGTRYEKIGIKKERLIRPIRSIRCPLIIDAIDVIVIKKYPTIIAENGKNFSMSVYHGLLQKNKKSPRNVSYFLTIVAIETGQIQSKQPILKKSKVVIRLDS